MPLTCPALPPCTLQERYYRWLSRLRQWVFCVDSHPTSLEDLKEFISRGNFTIFMYESADVLSDQLSTEGTYGGCYTCCSDHQPQSVLKPSTRKCVRTVNPKGICVLILYKIFFWQPSSDTKSTLQDLCPSFLDFVSDEGCSNLPISAYIDAYSDVELSTVEGI